MRGCTPRDAEEPAPKRSARGKPARGVPGACDGRPAGEFGSRGLLGLPNRPTLQIPLAQAAAEARSAARALCPRNLDGSGRERGGNSLWRQHSAARGGCQAPEFYPAGRACGGQPGALLEAVSDQQCPRRQGGVEAALRSQLVPICQARSEPRQLGHEVGPSFEVSTRRRSLHQADPALGIAHDPADPAAAAKDVPGDHLQRLVQLEQRSSQAGSGTRGLLGRRAQCRSSRISSATSRRARAARLVGVAEPVA